MLQSLSSTLAESALASAIRHSELAYPLLNSLHIVGIGILLGNILLLDLRLLGVLRQNALAEVLSLLSRIAGLGLGLAIASGLLLFSVQPQHYLHNPAFLLKLALLSLALLNLLLVQYSQSWRQAQSGGKVNSGLKLAAACSLLLWLAIIIAGRWIAFV
jgi:hypothetical protein